MALFNHNGTICPEGTLLYTLRNRALRYGEGLIETMLWQHQKVRLFERHSKRLQDSLATLEFPSFSAEQLRKAIHQVIQANGEPEKGMLRAQFFREGEEEQLQYTVEFIPIDPATGSWPGKGLAVGISNKVTKPADSISHLKTTSRLPYIIAAKEAKDQGWDDALLLNGRGTIAESTICNIFIVKNNSLYTPPLSDGGIAGVMRNYLLGQRTISGLNIEERSLDENDLNTAEEIFLVNAIRGVQPVVRFKDKTYGNNLSRNVFDLINAL